jgi:hypothetical protein
MKPLRLIIAAVLLASLGGVIWWSNRREAKKSAESTDTALRLINVQRDDIRQLRIEYPGSPAAIAQLDASGKWSLTAPEPYPADQERLQVVATAMAHMNGIVVVDEKPANLADFGLAPPLFTVTATFKDGKSISLLVGPSTPTAAGYYAKRGDQARVVTIAANDMMKLNHPYVDLRDRRVLRFDSEKLSAVELNSKAGPIEFGRGPTGDWRLLKPIQTRADGAAVEDMLHTLQFAFIDFSRPLEDAKKADAAFASGSKVATVTVTNASGKQTLELRKDKAGDHYVKTTTVDGVYKIQGELPSMLTKEAGGFRNKKLFAFGYVDPFRIEVKGQPAPLVVLDREGLKWMTGKKEFTSNSVQNLIDKLRDMTATSFPEKGGGDPAMELSVKDGDNRTVEHLTITKQGDRYFAKRDDDASIYELDSHTIDEVKKAASELKEQPQEAPKKK